MAEYRTLAKDSYEYKKLVAVAKILEAYSIHGARYVVEDVYLDLGQDWMWTTICRRGYSECQILSPSEWAMIVHAESPLKVAMCADEIMRGKYFHD